MKFVLSSNRIHSNYIAIFQRLIRNVQLTTVNLLFVLIRIECIIRIRWLPIRLIAKFPPGKANVYKELCNVKVFSKVVIGL